MTNNDMTRGSGGATPRMLHPLLAAICLDEGTQARVTIDALTVAGYAKAMMEGDSLHVPVVFFDGAVYYLADGFHRFQANRQIGATTKLCEVRCGDPQDARFYAFGAKRSHGLWRISEDERKAVQRMLAVCSDWSDRAISKHVGESDPFIASIRNAEQKARQAETRTSSKPAKVETVSTRPAVKQPGEQGAVQSAGQPAWNGGDLAEQAEVEAVSTPPLDPLAYWVAELEQVAAELLADNKAMSEVFDADEKLAALLAENKKLRAEIGVLCERVHGLMNEKNEAIRLMKHRRKTAQKAEAAA